MSKEICNRCNGSGTFHGVAAAVSGQRIRQQIVKTDCSRCGGKGWIDLSNEAEENPKAEILERALKRIENAGNLAVSA